MNVNKMNPKNHVVRCGGELAFFCAVILLTVAAAPDYREQVFTQINALRTKRGLASLAARDDLHRIAAAYAQELAGRHELSHYGKDGTALDKRLNAAGCTAWRSAGENLARSTFAGFTVADIVRSWNLSAGHYANIITAEFRYTGIGWALDARREQIYIVQIFIE